MGKIIIGVLMCLCINGFSQIKSVKAEKTISGVFFENKDFRNIKPLFKNQKNVSFNKDVETSLVSSFCNTSEKIMNEYSVGRKHVTFSSSDLERIDTTISYVKINYGFTFFSLDNKKYSIVNYDFYINGGGTTRQKFTRFLHKYEDNKWVYIEDRREDWLLTDLTTMIGKIKVSAWQILIGINPPATDAEKALVAKYVLKGGNVNLLLLLEDYRSAKDKSLNPFLNK